MALIKCIECGKDISDRASACPGCGAPVGQRAAAASTAPSPEAVTRSVRVERAGFKWEAIGFILIVAAIFIGIAGGGGFTWLLGFAGFIVFIIGRFID